jgi:hypothetical protein
MPEAIAYVPVRERWLPEVFTRIAELERTGGEAEAVEVGGGTPVEPTSELDPALIRRMYEESHDPHKRLMEYLAEHPDEGIYTSALASDLGLEHGARSLAGMLGAFGRRAQHRYGRRTPWESRWDGAAGEVKHKMTSEVAEEIKKVASGS